MKTNSQAAGTSARTIWIISLQIALVSTCLALLLWHLDIFKEVEAKTFDFRARLFSAPVPQSDQIRLIYLDQAGLDWAEKEMGLGWPWPREMYAPIVDFLKRHGAAAVVFDVLYTEPSFYGKDDDNAFGRSINEMGRFAVASAISASDKAPSNWPLDLPVPSVTVNGLDAWALEASGVVAQRMVFPITEVAQNAAVLANVQADPDPDTVYRRVRLFNSFDGYPVPFLGLGGYLAAHPDADLTLAPGELIFEGRRVGLDDKGQVILNFRGDNAYKAYSAAAVIQSELRLRDGQEPVIDGEQAFRGKYVFFGFTAPGLLDLRPTPMGGVTPGVVLGATTLDNLLAGDFVTSPPMIVLVLLTAAFALVTALALAPLQHGAAVIGVNLAAVLLPGVVCAGAYAVLRSWYPFVLFEAAVIPTGFGVSLLKFITQGLRKRFIKNAFQQYLSPKVIEQLLDDPDRLKLGGEKRELTIFFSDLQGFTSISEKLEPEVLSSVLNDYLSAMTDIIHEEGGTVDKYEGDAIIAFWNAPVEQDDHARRGVQAMLRCQEKLAEMRGELKERTGSDFLMRIGMNTGFAVVGNMGSHSRFDYTMLGDSVNLAARLEGINKKFDTYSMISEETMNRCGDEFGFRELGLIRVVGKNTPVRVFEPMRQGERAARAQDFEQFGSALELFRQGEFARAAKTFESTASVDPAAGKYREKCLELQAASPPDWDGVWNMTSK